MNMSKIHVFMGYISCVPYNTFVHFSTFILLIMVKKDWVKYMYYTDRLKWVRDCKNISQRELAAYLGIRQQQYARYEKGVNIMPVTYLIKICKYLNVSADYILGLTDNMTTFQDTKNEKALA